MIKGFVTPDQRALIEVTVVGPSGMRLLVEAMLDTGFTGHLKLTPDTIETLDLTYDDEVVALLADGSVVSLKQFIGWVEWEGAARKVLVLASPGGSLAGMGLIQGSRLTLDAVPGGAVGIEPIPPETAA